jgi:2-polyprenyl-3-methyl-5-hydroxy-6-metoxy-1,4-benzoquinol methylase
MSNLIKDQMERIYREMPIEEIPWNSADPPGLLVQLVDTKKVEPCRVVEFGCGAGNAAVYLASKGFSVTGIDFSERAVEIARGASQKKGVDCRFVAADLLGDLSAVKTRFDFAFDWEVLHHVFPEYRGKYLDNVCGLIRPGGHYLTVCFSEDSPAFGGKGKFRQTPLGTILYFSSEAEVETLLKPLFEIEELATVNVQNKLGPHRAIYAFARKKLLR